MGIRDRIKIAHERVELAKNNEGDGPAQPHLCRALNLLELAHVVAPADREAAVDALIAAIIATEKLSTRYIVRGAIARLVI